MYYIEATINNSVKIPNYRMALAFRGALRSVARRLQVRSYADAPKGDEMALTFAAGNKVIISIYY